MTTIPIKSAKLSVAFPPGSLPRISPTRPSFVLNLGQGVHVHGAITGTVARRLEQHEGGVVLAGRLLVSSKGQLVLTDCVVTFVEPKPASSPISEKIASLSEAEAP